MVTGMGCPATAYAEAGARRRTSVGLFRTKDNETTSAGSNELEVQADPETGSTWSK